MPQAALDKKSNFECLEKEVGFKRFLPKSVTDSMKVHNIMHLLYIEMFIFNIQILLSLNSHHF